MNSEDEKIPVDYAAMPHAFFGSPQVAGVGFTDQRLKNRIEGKDYLKLFIPYIQTVMLIASHLHIIIRLEAIEYQNRHSRRTINKPNQLVENNEIATNNSLSNFIF